MSVSPLFLTSVSGKILWLGKNMDIEAQVTFRRFLEGVRREAVGAEAEPHS